MSIIYVLTKPYDRLRAPIDYAVYGRPIDYDDYALTVYGQRHWRSHRAPVSLDLTCGPSIANCPCTLATWHSTG